MIQFNLFDCIKRLERHKGQTVSQAYVAEGSGLSRYTVQKIVNNDTPRVDRDTLTKLLVFFHNEGLDLSVGDLFTYDKRAVLEARHD